jgi:hypothetical protein
MKKQSRGLSTRAEITIHKVPVVGVVGFIFVVGIIAIALLGLPVTKWFLLASLLAGIAVAGTIRLAHKLRPRTEEEEIQLNVGRQTRQPWISLRFRKLLGVEHWVGGNLEFARLWIE